MEHTYFIVVVIFIFGVSSVISKEDSLLSVVQVFRHGERTPILFYTSDPYKDPSYWDGLGTGQLTKYGKVQLTELGKYFRDKYDGFVSTNYTEEEIYISTVSGDRNLQSAESFLTGLYPNEDTEIPIHRTPLAVMDTLVECLRYDLEWTYLQLNNEYFKKINEDNKEDYKYIRKHSVYPVFELLGANSIWDTLLIEKRFNLTLPQWTDSVFPDKLKNMSDLYALSLCYDDSLQRLATGVFIKELIHHFESVLSNGSSQKIQLYSAHDVNIACLLSTFEAFSKPHLPDFASSLIFELRQGSKGNYINTYYKPDNEMVPINLRGCASDCKIDDFKTVFSSIAISELEWAKKCYTPL